MRPYTYTRFHTQVDIRASALDNQFVYTVDGKEAGYWRANILGEIVAWSWILDNRQ